MGGTELSPNSRSVDKACRAMAASSRWPPEGGTPWLQVGKSPRHCRSASSWRRCAVVRASSLSSWYCCTAGISRWRTRSCCCRRRSESVVRWYMSSKKARESTAIESACWVPNRTKPRTRAGLNLHRSCTDNKGRSSLSEAVLR